jgi:hypothetical protein
MKVWMHRWQTQMNAIKKFLASFHYMHLGDIVSFQHFLDIRVIHKVTVLSLCYHCVLPSSILKLC